MKTRTILRLTLLTLGCAAVLWPGETHAQRRGFEAPDPRLQKSERRTTERLGQAVRLHGKVQVTRRGVQLAGQPLVLTATTTVFPGSGDLSSPHLAKRLRGEEATVYGRRTARGVEVALVILTQEDPDVPLDTGLGDLLEGARPDPSTHRLPPIVDGTLGPLTEDAPH